MLKHAKRGIDGKLFCGLWQSWQEGLHALTVILAEESANRCLSVLRFSGTPVARLRGYALTTLIFHLTNPAFSWTLPLNPLESRRPCTWDRRDTSFCVISMGLGVGVSKGLLAHHYYLLTKAALVLFVD